MDRVISGLHSDSFQVYENEVQQTIAHFVLEEAPISVCLVFDASLSMSGKLRRARLAVSQILQTARPDDEYCLIRFSDRPEILVELTHGPQKVAEEMSRIDADGRTALLDAIYLGIGEITRAQNRRKALVVISDGGDNRSRHTQRAIKKLVREADVQIYSVGLLSPGYQLSTQEEADGPALLEAISEQSGGRLFRVHALESMQEAIEKINTALRQQYVLGYYPKSARNDGKYRRVTIKLNAPENFTGLRAYWRPGYYAPKR
jgi:Ca-activated chloride channel family protein